MDRGCFETADSFPRTIETRGSVSSLHRPKPLALPRYSGVLEAKSDFGPSKSRLPFRGSSGLESQEASTPVHGATRERDKRKIANSYKSNSNASMTLLRQTSLQ